MKTQAAIILVHGGAGAIPDSRVKYKYEGTKSAVKAGILALLSNGGSATKAVCNAVASMEDDPSFNAGYGSMLNEGKELVHVVMPKMYIHLCAFLKHDLFHLNC